MNFKLVLNFLGKITAYYFTGVMAVPLLVALYYGESLIPFVIPMVVSIVLGGMLTSLKPENEVFRYKEGLAVVGLGWLIVSFIGSLPFVAIGFHPVDALFETMSGFTTTGASIIDNVEALPGSILLWRNFTQWLGGMGIIVLFVAVIPVIASKSETLFPAEFPGVTLEKIRPRLEDTAKSLYSIYIIFTALNIVVLYVLGVPLFDSVVHAFSNISTGGFSSHMESIAYFNSGLVEAAVTFFMVVGGTNFALYYYLFMERRPIYRDSEFKTYLSILALASTIIILLNMNMNMDMGLLNSIRYSVFNAVSVATATGYATYDFDTWHNGAKMILLILMFIGGCSGSTAGGIKVVRVYLLLKYMVTRVLKVAEPRTARAVKYGDKVVKGNMVNEVVAFFILYIMVFTASIILISLSGYGLLTSASSVASCMGNVGPGMGLAGPTETYSFYPYYIKAILTIDMWIGRLEVFPVLALFMPQFWREGW